MEIKFRACEKNQYFPMHKAPATLQSTAVGPPNRQLSTPSLTTFPTPSATASLNFQSQVFPKTIPSFMPYDAATMMDFWPWFAFNFITV